MKIVKRLMLAALFSILVASIAGAQTIPQATNPEEVGLSKERLQRISTWIQSDVDKGTVPGAVVMVLRKGKIAYEGRWHRHENICLKGIEKSWREGGNACTRKIFFNRHGHALAWPVPRPR